VNNNNPGRQRNRVGDSTLHHLLRQAPLFCGYKEDGLPHDWVIAVFKNGWITDKLGLQGLKHFDAHTKRHTIGTHQLLILDGHESHNSLKLKQYCKKNNITTLRMPPHLLYLL
jgi:hypothetical protein